METKPTKDQIIALLDAWIRQRPGLEFANYGDWKAYRSELRSITKDGTEAKQLLRYVAARDSITADMMLEGFRAFSGRLSITPGKKPGTWRLDYCTGQYWPTEYRRAACAVLSAVVWDWMRERCMPAPTYTHHGKAGEPMLTEARYNGLSAGDYLRKAARREFGRGIASRWFN